MRRYIAILALMALAACSKGDSVSTPKNNDGGSNNKTPQNFTIKEIKVSDTVVIGRDLNLDVEIPESGSYTFKYTITKDGQTIATVNNVKTAISTDNWQEGVYKVDVAVINSDNVEKKASKSFTALKPYWGVAILGDTKETIVEEEKNKNNISPKTVLVGLHSKYNNQDGVEKVMFTDKSGYNYFVYYFKNGRLIAGEASHKILSNGNSYAVYVSIRNKLKAFIGNDGETTQTFTMFDKNTYDDLFNKRDYATISLYVSTGQYAEACQYENQKYYGSQYIKLNSKVVIHSEIGLK